MNFEYFGNLSKEEAEMVLREFLEDGKANIDTVIAHANQAGVDCDYSIESLPPFLHWALSEMHIVPKEPDMSVPAFIRSTGDYQSGLFDFDERSKNLICFAAYYFGECFTRSYPQLKWSTGYTEYSTGNMPVITGFIYDKELPPMLVLENLFRRVISKPERKMDVSKAAANWEKYIPRV